jgi:hypothetical protein
LLQWVGVAQPLAHVVADKCTTRSASSHGVKPTHVIEAEHKRLCQHASRKQTKLDPRSLIAAEYLALETLLRGAFPANEMLAVYRSRWSIE